MLSQKVKLIQIIPRMLNCVALLLEANNIHPCNDEWLALMFLDALTCEQESLHL